LLGIMRLSGGLKERSRTNCSTTADWVDKTARTTAVQTAV